MIRSREEHHQMMVQWSEKMKREREARPHGPFMSEPEPPGDWREWDSVIHNDAAFAAAGLCELWRMDLADETRFFRFTDFPPGFNFSGMWWRKAS
jgi:hypothetical protein